MKLTEKDSLCLCTNTIKYSNFYFQKLSSSNGVIMSIRGPDPTRGPPLIKDQRVSGKMISAFLTSQLKEC
jgi:hypothetical protein